MIIAELDVKMPTHCAECGFYTDTPMGCSCKLVAYRGAGVGKNRPTNCPLKEFGTCKTCKHADHTYSLMRCNNNMLVGWVYDDDYCSDWGVSDGDIHKARQNGNA